MKKLVIIMAFWGCAGPDVPEVPTFEEHVQPILEANCLRCHSDPPIGSDPRDSDGDPVRFDTQARAEGFALKIANQVNLGRMPPTYSLEDWQIDTLINWCVGFNGEFCE